MGSQRVGHDWASRHSTANYCTFTGTDGAEPGVGSSSSWAEMKQGSAGCACLPPSPHPQHGQECELGEGPRSVSVVCSLKMWNPQSSFFHSQSGVRAHGVPSRSCVSNMLCMSELADKWVVIACFSQHHSPYQPIWLLQERKDMISCLWPPGGSVRENHFSHCLIALCLGSAKRTPGQAETFPAQAFKAG